MLETAELQLLSKWCRARRLHWQPGVADDGRPALLLLGVPQQTMLLLPDEEEWHLLDEPGAVLACASGLTELLDALDAGMGAETTDALAGAPRHERRLDYSDERRLDYSYARWLDDTREPGRLDDPLFEMFDDAARSRRGVVFA